MMGACGASSTVNGCNINGNTCGGNSKQGLPFNIDSNTYNHKNIKINATGDKRDFVFTINQLGGVSSSSFRSSVNGFAGGDGIRPNVPYQFR